MKNTEFHFDTIMVHGGYVPDPDGGASTPSLVQSNAFAYETAEALSDVFAGRQPGYVYSRIANPTVAQFEQRVKLLENGIGAVACSSGMAAISSTVLALAGAGDEIVAGNSLFGGTFSLFKQTLSRYGINVRFVEATAPEAFREAINDRTRMVYIETIGNPKLDVPDLAKISEITRETGVVLAVDNTVASPMLCRPGEFGADIVIHSTSKFISGHGNAIGGIIIDTGSFNWSSSRYPHLSELYKKARNLTFIAYLRNRIVRDFGCSQQPFNAFLMSMGMETLALRMERHCFNTLTLAEYLAGHPKIIEVTYPGLWWHPQRAIAEHQFSGKFGALLTLKLEDQASCFKFINGLKLIHNLVNLGDTRTLAVHPASTICRDMDVMERLAMGVTDDIVRLAVGIEHANDLIADIGQSLSKV